jgi:hypothetical protein
MAHRGTMAVGVLYKHLDMTARLQPRTTRTANDKRHEQLMLQWAMRKAWQSAINSKLTLNKGRKTISITTICC